MLPLFPGSDIQDSTFHHLINQMAPVTADWSNDKGLSLLVVGPSNKEIFDFHI